MDATGSGWSVTIELFEDEDTKALTGNAGYRESFERADACGARGVARVICEFTVYT